MTSQVQEAALALMSPEQKARVAWHDNCSRQVYAYYDIANYTGKRVKHAWCGRFILTRYSYRNTKTGKYHVQVGERGPDAEEDGYVFEFDTKAERDKFVEDVIGDLESFINDACRRLTKAYRSKGMGKRYGQIIH